MNICIYIFHHNGANKNNTEVISADKIFVEVVVLICPSRAATRGNGGNQHGGALTLKVHTPFKAIPEWELYTRSEQNHRK